ncbi:MAG: sigma-70 family RNA polymerase sigma factor [Myxococcota bacterium]
MVRDDDTTFRDFYREHLSFVVRSARLLGVRDPQLEDLVQEVFIAAHRRFEVREAAATKAWLFCTTRNLAMRTRRADFRFARRRAALREANVIRGSDRSFETWDARRALGRFLDALGEDQRAVFVGVELMGMSAVELGRALDVKVNTIYSRLRLARARLDGFARDEQLHRGDLLERARAAGRPNSRLSSVVWVGISTRIGLSAGTAGTLGTVAMAPVVAKPAFAAVMLALLLSPAPPQHHRSEDPAVQARGERVVSAPRDPATPTDDRVVDGVVDGVADGVADAVALREVVPAAAPEHGVVARRDGLDDGERHPAASKPSPRIRTRRARARRSQAPTPALDAPSSESNPASALAASSDAGRALGLATSRADVGRPEPTESLEAPRAPPARLPAPRPTLGATVAAAPTAAPAYSALAVLVFLE